MKKGGQSVFQVGRTPAPFFYDSSLRPMARDEADHVTSRVQTVRRWMRRTDGWT